MDTNTDRSIPRVPFVDLAAQYAPIAEEIDGAVSEVLRGMDCILGRSVRLFEEEFAAFCEAEHGVGVDSGTSALELALRACGIEDRITGKGRLLEEF